MSIINTVKTASRKLLPQKLVNIVSQHIYKPYPMNWTDKEREESLDKKYFPIFKRHIDFENPKRYSEKFQWYKLYYDNPDFKNIVCKVNFKKYIASKLGEGYTLPMYGAWTNVDDIDWESLPDSFVLKGNCQSDSKCIKIIEDKSKYSLDELKDELREWLDPKKTLVASLCRAYYDVVPMIYAEEYLKSTDNDGLTDYKLFCFGGKVEFANAYSERVFGESVNISMYDLDWNPLPFVYGDHEGNKNTIEKPRHFDKMMEIAAKLSKGIPFVRVDFYEVGDRVLLSELTFYPGGGYNVFADEVEEKYGKLFKLPPKSVLGRKYRNDI